MKAMLLEKYTAMGYSKRTVERALTSIKRERIREEFGQEALDAEIDWWRRIRDPNVIRLPDGVKS